MPGQAHAWDKLGLTLAGMTVPTVFQLRLTTTSLSTHPCVFRVARMRGWEDADLMGPPSMLLMNAPSVPTHAQTFCEMMHYVYFLANTQNAARVKGPTKCSQKTKMSDQKRKRLLFQVDSTQTILYVESFLGVASLASTQTGDRPWLRTELPNTTL